jgi:predicted Kef-type K+ transport protein
MGRTGRVLATLAGAVVALAALEVRAATEPLSDTVALGWLVLVATVTLVVHLVLVRRYVAVPVSHR